MSNTHTHTHSVRWLSCCFLLLCLLLLLLCYLLMLPEPEKSEQNAISACSFWDSNWIRHAADFLQLALMEWNGSDEGKRNVTSKLHTHTHTHRLRFAAAAHSGHFCSCCCCNRLKWVKHTKGPPAACVCVCNVIVVVRATLTSEKLSTVCARGK